MAKIHQETIVITLNKLVKDGQELAAGTLANADVVAALEQVAQELAGTDIIVEAQVA